MTKKLDKKMNGVPFRRTKLCIETKVPSEVACRRHAVVLENERWKLHRYNPHEKLRCFATRPWYKIEKVWGRWSDHIYNLWQSEWDSRLAIFLLHIGVNDVYKDGMISNWKIAKRVCRIDVLKMYEYREVKGLLEEVEGYAKMIKPSEWIIGCNLRKNESWNNFLNQVESHPITDQS